MTLVLAFLKILKQGFQYICFAKEVLLYTVLFSLILLLLKSILCSFQFD